MSIYLHIVTFLLYKIWGGFLQIRSKHAIEQQRLIGISSVQSEGQTCSTLKVADSSLSFCATVNAFSLSASATSIVNVSRRIYA